LSEGKRNVEKMTTIVTQELARVWNDLQAIVPVTAIHTEPQYEQAIETLHTLLDLVGEDETHPLYELLDTLGTLVHTYEEEHYPAPTVNGVDVFKFLMDEHQLNLSSFPEIGQEEEVSKLLSGKRELKASEIRALSNRFQISPASFI
jgi:HTH-type transcriptional regulator/antitoxin HigA